MIPETQAKSLSIEEGKYQIDFTIQVGKTSRKVSLSSATLNDNVHIDVAPTPASKNRDSLVQLEKEPQNTEQYTRIFIQKVAESNNGYKISYPHPTDQNVESYNNAAFGCAFDICNECIAKDYSNADLDKPDTTTIINQPPTFPSVSMACSMPSMSAKSPTSKTSVIQPLDTTVIKPSALNNNNKSKTEISHSTSRKPVEPTPTMPDSNVSTQPNSGIGGSNSAQPDFDKESTLSWNLESLDDSSRISTIMSSSSHMIVSTTSYRHTPIKAKTIISNCPTLTKKSRVKSSFKKLSPDDICIIPPSPPRPRPSTFFNLLPPPTISTTTTNVTPTLGFIESRTKNGTYNDRVNYSQPKPADVKVKSRIVTLKNSIHDEKNSDTITLYNEPVRFEKDLNNDAALSHQTPRIPSSVSGSGLSIDGTILSSKSPTTVTRSSTIKDQTTRSSSAIENSVHQTVRSKSSLSNMNGPPSAIFATALSKVIADVGVDPITNNDNRIISKSIKSQKRSITVEPSKAVNPSLAAKSSVGAVVKPKTKDSCHQTMDALQSATSNSTPTMSHHDKKSRSKNNFTSTMSSKMTKPSKATTSTLIVDSEANDSNVRAHKRARFLNSSTADASGTPTSINRIPSAKKTAGSRHGMFGLTAFEQALNAMSFKYPSTSHTTAL
ncbi:hypothetical protein FBU30_004415 [Linnemannia zychae]|nr:hypothetical protein FBU30_004415 [Linnemannia zychae]